MSCDLGFVKQDNVYVTPNVRPRMSCDGLALLLDGKLFPPTYAHA